MWYYPSYILYPFEIYNDAAKKALTELNVQFIYGTFNLILLDEILGEVNLAFDQMIFKMGKRIFVHYKRMASS